MCHTHRASDFARSPSATAHTVAHWRIPGVGELFALAEGDGVRWITEVADALVEIYNRTGNLEDTWPV